MKPLGRVYFARLSCPCETMKRNNAVGLPRKRDNTSDALNARRNGNQSSQPSERNKRPKQPTSFAVQQTVVETQTASSSNTLDEIHSPESLYFQDDNDYSQWVCPGDFESEDEEVELGRDQVPIAQESSGSALQINSDDVSDSDDEYCRRTRGSFVLGKIIKCLGDCDTFIKANNGGDSPVEEGSKVTLSEFSLQLQGVFSLSNLETKYETLILGLLRKTLTKSMIPARISHLGNSISDLNKYIPPSRQLIEIGACHNDCCVFTGVPESKCTECGTHRYTSKYSKVNRKSIFYRSLTGTIIQLLHYPLFVRLLHYKYMKPSTDRVYDNMNVMDGRNARKHLNSMQQRYSKKFMQSSQKPTEINILISLFYDGIQLFRKKQENYWPLFCTILNLPPSLRAKVGAGMFMLSAFYGRLDSATEEFIFNDCLIAELQILYKGLLVEVAGTQYFMQVFYKDNFLSICII